MKFRKARIEKFEGSTVYKIPDEIARELGHVIARWANLERHLKLVIYNLVGIDDVIGRVVIGKARAHEQIGRVEDVLTALRLTVKSPLKEIKKSLAELESSRNALAHGQWLITPGSDQLFLLDLSDNWPLGEGISRHTKRMFPDTKPVGQGDLIKLVNDMDVEIERLDKLNEEVRALRRSLHGKSPEQAP
jgi:hypothetical protein